MQFTTQQDNTVYKQKESEILSLADNMASAAASFSSHGYDSFISSREVLKDAIHDLVLQMKI